MKSLFSVVCVCAIAQAGFAAEYYVNPNIGDDGFDGKSAVIGEVNPQTSVTNGPRKTLKAIMALATKSGDVVHAAEGVYNEGVCPVANLTSNRVVVAAGVGLVADGARDKTIIEGARASSPAKTSDLGCGSDAIRCVALKANAWIKGFTVRGGATVISSGYYDDRGGGIYCYDVSAMAVDCTVTNCVAARGGGAAHGHYVRCLFIDNHSCSASMSNTQTYSSNGGFYGCVFHQESMVGSYQMYGTGYKLVNCTVLNGQVRGNGSWIPVYNSYVYHDSGYLQCHRSIVRSSESSSTSTFDDGAMKDTGYIPQLEAGTCRPLASETRLIDQGNDEYFSHYPEKFRNNPALFGDGDYAGAPRVMGAAIDIGASEYDWRADDLASKGLGCAVEKLGDDQYKVIIRRNHQTEKLVTGFTFADDTVTYADYAWDYVYTNTLTLAQYNKGLLGVTYAATQTDWYVSPTGDDTAKGYSPYCPRKTLMAAMALATKKGDVVHAAEGTYDENSYEGATSGMAARVLINAGVKLVASGDKTKTIIRGKKSDTTTGQGADALRGVIMRAGSVIEGFTIQEGRTRPGTSYTYGGGIFAYPGMDSSAGEYVTILNCIVRDCMAERGGAIEGDYGNRGVCYVFNTLVSECSGTSPGTVRGARCWNCVIRSTTGNNQLVAATAYNCSLLGTCGTAGQMGASVYLYNCVAHNFACGEASSAFTKCALNGSMTTGTYTDCITPSPTIDQLAVDAQERPLAGGVCVNAGDSAHYHAELIPPEAADYANVDYAGAPRVMGGAIDIGACEYDWRTLPTTSGLTLTITDKGDETYDVTIARNYTSEKLTTGFTFGDVTVNFADHPEGYVYGVNLPEADLVAKTLTPLYAETQTDWYVNPTGDDTAKGYSPYCPRKTLKAAMALAQKGDIVHAAAGTYDEGVVAPASGTTSNRVAVAEGVGLVADEGAANTFIVGFKSADSNGRGTSAVRCVFLYKNAYVQGFTITNGATHQVSDSGECGGGVLSVDMDNCAAIDCRIVGNTAARGGGVSTVTCIRCLFDGNTAAAWSNGPGAYWGHFIDCVSMGDNFYVDGLVLNCTIYGNVASASSVKSGFLYSNVRHAYSQTINSIICQDRGSRYYSNCVFQASSVSSSSSADGACAFGVTAAAVQEPNYRSLDANICDKGITEAYEAHFPAKWSAFKTNKDIAGGERKLGASIDIGAGEFDWRETAPSTGLTLTTEALGGGAVKATFTRNYTTEKLLASYTFAGETITFDDGEAHTWTLTAAEANQAALSQLVYAATQTDWYVSPAGDDSAKGYHRNCPRKTLKAAMALAQAGDVVHAAAGTYDEGVDRVSGYVTSNRVIVAEGVGLVADEGPEVTVIRGYQTPERGGMATGAVRCVWLSTGAYVKGFTLTGGAAVRTDEYGESGGGVGCAKGNEAAVVDCILTGNKAQRGGGSFNATCIRCLFDGNAAGAWSNGEGAYYGSLIDCVSTSNNLYTTGLALNTTVMNPRHTANQGMLHSPSAGAMSINCAVDTDRGNRVYSNCVFRASALYSGKSTADASCLFGCEDVNQVDASTYRPRRWFSKLVDRGWDAAYEAHFPAKWSAFKTNTDLKGGARILGASIDIGAGEYNPASRPGTVILFH